MATNRGVAYIKPGEVDISEPSATKRKPPAVAMCSTLAARLGTKTWGVMVGCDSVPPNDPKLSDPAREGPRLQPRGDGRVRCSAWLGGTLCMGLKTTRGQMHRTRRAASDSRAALSALCDRRVLCVRTTEASRQGRQDRQEKPTDARTGAALWVTFMAKRPVPPNDPSSATRPTRSHDCNREVMAGFAAAPG